MTFIQLVASMGILLLETSTKMLLAEIVTLPSLYFFCFSKGLILHVLLATKSTRVPTIRM